MSAATEPRHGPPESHLSAGDTCAHVARCVGVLGCTWPTRRECDFSPSRFRRREDASLRRDRSAAFTARAANRLAGEAEAIEAGPVPERATTPATARRDGRPAGEWERNEARRARGGRQQ